VTSTKNVWGETVTIRENGIRSNGNPDKHGLTGPPILAVGDSFTFGDQVSDAETWPAIPEGLIDRPVINGGVFGYGMDQSFLRAGELAEIYRPDTVIFGNTADDIERCEHSARQGANKPYFIAVGDRPVLKTHSHEAHRGNFRAVLGRSLLVHKLMMRCCANWWLLGVTWDEFYRAKRVHTQGEKVACLIVQELDKMVRRLGVRRVMLLIQYSETPSAQSIERIQSVIACGKKLKSLEIVDLRTALESVRQTDPERFKRFYDRHLTAEGNAFVAKHVYATLSSIQDRALPSNND